MASRRMLKHTVVLYNYIGEVNDVATYQVTIIEPCCCPSSMGSSQGVNGVDSATLYVFDHITKAKSEGGTLRSYIPYDQWLNTEDSAKGNYWTLSDRGTDFFSIGSVVRSPAQDFAGKFKVADFQRFDTGSKRMWHWEVRGE